MSDSVIDTKAFPLITELKSGVALANALHAHLTDTGCSAAHEQIQALLAATRELAEAVGSELAGIEHYEQGAREAGSLCFWKRCRALRSARGGSSSANGNNVTLIFEPVAGSVCLWPRQLYGWPAAARLRIGSGGQPAAGFRARL